MELQVPYSVCSKISKESFFRRKKVTVGKDTKAIKKYIANQIERDREGDQLSLFDPRDPFTGK